jgi:hypothetical protein
MNKNMAENFSIKQLAREVMPNLRVLRIFTSGSQQSLKHRPKKGRFAADLMIGESWGRHFLHTRKDLSSGCAETIYVYYSN